MQRPSRLFETTQEEKPVEKLIEWQEHRYDPGYYTGGNIHPLYAAARPNKYGYFLILGAVMTSLVLVLGIRAGAMNWYSVSVTTALVLFMFLVGFKLIKKPSNRNVSAEKRGGPRKLDD